MASPAEVPEGDAPFDCDVALTKTGSELFRELNRLYAPASFEDYFLMGKWKDDLMKLDIQLFFDHRKGGANPNPPNLDSIPTPKLPAPPALIAPKLGVPGAKLGGMIIPGAKAKIVYLPLVVEGHGAVMTKVGENKYRVNAAQGLAFRAMKNLASKVQDPQPAACQEVINGIDEGDGWLKTQGRGPAPVAVAAKAAAPVEDAPKDELEELLQKLPPAKGSLAGGAVKRFGEGGPKAKAKAPPVAQAELSDEAFMADLMAPSEEEQIAMFVVDNNLDQTWTEGLLLGIEEVQRKFVIDNFKATSLDPSMEQEATDELEKYIAGCPWDKKKVTAGIVRVGAMAAKPAVAAKAGNWHQAAMANFMGQPRGQGLVTPAAAKQPAAAKPGQARFPGQLAAAPAPAKRPLSAVSTLLNSVKAPKVMPVVPKPGVYNPKGSVVARPAGLMTGRPPLGKVPGAKAVMAGKPAGATLGIRPKGA